GTHLLPGDSYNLNQPAIAGFAENDCGRPVPPQPCLERYPYYARYGWTHAVPYFGDDASSNYNSLQTRMVKRFSRGYQFQLNYVWGKGLGYDDDYFAIDPRLNYGPNDFDRTHRLIVFNVLEIPIGKGKPLLGNSGRVLNSLIGGWSLTSITNWSSGLPFSLTYIGSECTNDRDTGPCRPNVVGPVQILKDRTEYFTTTGGESLASGTATQPGEAIGPWQRPTVGTFGNTTRNSLRGPGLLNTDLVILKDLGIGERYRAQFRVEFANV